jgi:N-acetylneuraminic acid mutarotase
MGGGTDNNDLTTATNQAWSYDPKKGRWKKLADVPGPPRLVHAAGVLNKKIFIFGGLTKKAGEPYSNLADAYSFDTKTGKWNTIKSLPEAARAFSATSTGRHVYLFGGMGRQGLDTVYRYNASRDDYELISRMPLALMDTKFFYYRGAFYGAAGEDKAASRFSGLLIGRRKNLFNLSRSQD